MAESFSSVPELVLDARADLGEGPAWEPRSGLLYWVDIRTGHLHAFNPADGSDRRVEVGESLGCAAPRRTGGLVLGLRSGLAVLDSMDAKVRVLANPEPQLPGNRFNDGKCDPAGRFPGRQHGQCRGGSDRFALLAGPDGSIKG